MMILNPDRKIVEAITRRLIATNGQCPCVPEHKWTEDTICECKEKRDKEICHCSLFVKKES